MKAFSKGQIFGYPELKGIFSEFREALNEEINYIEKNGQSSILLYAGQKLETRTSEYCYRFHIEYMPALPPDTPCKLLVGQLQFDVTVVSVEESAITIASTTELPDTIGKARLDTGATILMERLIQRIEHIADEENEIGKHLIPLDDQSLPQSTVYPFKHLYSDQDIIFSQKNSPAQNKAIRSALTNDVTYIWGPPGTGKTTVIGQIIDELYKQDRSVLLVSHTNTAVDGAIKKADESYIRTHSENESNYPILRLGTFSNKLPKRASLDAHIAKLGKELYQQKADLENLQITLQKRIDKINWVQTNQLGKVKELLQTIDNCEARKKQLEQEVDHLSTIIDHQKMDPSLYDHYVDSTKIYNDKLSEYHAVCNREKKVKLNIRALSLQRHTTSLEIQKYDQWSELRARLSKYPSKKILEEKLSTIHTRITSLLSGIQALEEEQRVAQLTISTYEKKSALGKLFAGKNSILQARSTLESTIPRLSKAKENLQLQKDVENKYQQNLDMLLSLQEKVTSLTPSKSKDFSVSRLHQLENSIASAQNRLLVFSGQKDRLYKEIEQLNDQLDQSKATFEAFHTLQQELQETKQQLADITTLIQKDNELCSSYMYEESSRCSFFYRTTCEENYERFSELSELLSRTMTELNIVDLSALQGEKERSEESFRVLSAQLHDINLKIQELSQQAIFNAKIIGTTLAKSYLSESLQKRTFDTVILDEASMASIPALWCASYLAETSVVIVGDFLQLPPIVMAQTPMAQKWLGKDIFEHSGMQERAKHKLTCPDNFIMLNDQFRMEPDIAEMANMYYGEYGGLSSTELEKSEERSKQREEFNKWYPGKEGNHNIHLIDTESLHAWVTGVSQGTHHSRFNCFSAAVDVELAFKLLENKWNTPDSSHSSILIVAPYKPHIEKIKQLIELEYKNRGLPENSNYIQAGTIHSFQGQEADIVIFDLVIDEPHWRAGLFLDDDKYKEYNDNLRKMFNVAITRAKFKLFIVGNFAYCQKKAKNNALAELLNTLLNRYNLPKIDAKSILPDLVFSQNTVVSTDKAPGSAPGSLTLCREDAFDRYFMQDLQSFTKRLIIYSPFISQNRLSVLLPIFADAISSSKKVIVVTKALSDRKKSELSHYQTCEKQLRDRGVIVVHKQGMHEKLVFIDDEIVWMGSLNVLSFTGLTGEFMQRCENTSYVTKYEKAFSIDPICDVTSYSYGQKCPVCGGELLLKESAQGGVYWACVNNDYTRNPSQEYPTDGLLRCSKCGAPYLFSMKKEPRWICSRNPRHFQKIRRNDLKLEKMAALIPTKAARKKVDDFFLQKGNEMDKKTVSPSGETADLPISKAFVEDDQLKLF